MPDTTPAPTEPTDEDTHQRLFRVRRLINILDSLGKLYEEYRGLKEEIAQELMAEAHTEMVDLLEHELSNLPDTYQTMAVARLAKVNK